MSAFVVLAAGRGTRVGRAGENLHKSLLPLGDRAVLSHLIKLAPSDARLIICLGDRGRQLRDYVALAHPKLHVEFVEVEGWDQPGAGPGASLLAAKGMVGDDDMAFTSCDTLWERDDRLWDNPEDSWVATASLPSGTQPERWCRFDVEQWRVISVLDKCDGHADIERVYVGLAHISQHDLPLFWKGILSGATRENERQVSGGFSQLLAHDRKLLFHDVSWTDTGDEVGYRKAVAVRTGYDWTKTDQATYVLPDEGRVVKYMADTDSIRARSRRGSDLGDAVPQQVERRGNMIAYRYVNGVTAYEKIRWSATPTLVTRDLLAWRDKFLTTHVKCNDTVMLQATRDFYRDKTYQRIAQLRSGEQLKRQAIDAVDWVNWRQLASGFKPALIHGDLNFGNVIVSIGSHFTGIDWREDFAGRPWFDARYDLAKLLAGTVVHWDNARRGDFRPWDAGEAHAELIREHAGGNLQAVEIIGALSLINSAPLHAAPLDEILIARGTSWLERVL
jgi:choline kinase